MFIKIPFESEIEFKTNISEITKMSLEHDFNVNEGVVLGNFYVSGEYRVHPVSVNTESFNYTLPFTVELRDDINLDTLEFNIEDFSYDVCDDNKLKVNIEYSLKAELKEAEKEVQFERVDEEELSDEIAYIDSFLDKDEEDKKEMEKGEDNDGKVEEDSGKLEEETRKEEKIDRDMKYNEKTIMDTIKDNDDTFVTYHIHVVNTDETMENICNKYNVSMNTIMEYNNNLDTLTIGDKILIPEIDE